MYSLKCNKCGCTFECRGSYDPETNATELDEPGCPDCFSDDFEIIGEVPRDYDPTDVM